MAIFIIYMDRRAIDAVEAVDLVEARRSHAKRVNIRQLVRHPLQDHVNQTVLIARESLVGADEPPINQ